MSRTKLLPLAGAIASVLMSTAAMASTVDFHGYFRSGIGASGGGGDQEAFKAVGAGSKYRLGNETDTYGEIKLGSELFNNGEQSFYLDSMMAFGIDQANDWEESAVAFREFNIKSKGTLGFAPEATLWAGKRFYRRHDVHSSDFFYWDVSGPGAGIEEMNLGFADASLAWVKSSTKVTTYDSQANANADENASEKGLDQNIIDFRLENINVNPDGALTLGVDYAFSSTTDVNDLWYRDASGNAQTLSEDDLEDSGYMATLIHTQSNFFGGFNKFVVQYAKDAMAVDGLAARGQNIDMVDPKVSGDNLNAKSLTRVINHGLIGLGENTEMYYNALYSKASFRDSAKDDQTWISVGVTPLYNWNEIMSTQFEIGHDYVKNGVSNGVDSRLTKVTLSQEWSAGRGYWARPTIRVFGTYAKWNDESKGMIGGDAFANDTSGFTFGVQADAWW